MMDKKVYGMKEEFDCVTFKEKLPRNDERCEIVKYLKFKYQAFDYMKKCYPTAQAGVRALKYRVDKEGLEIDSDYAEFAMNKQLLSDCENYAILADSKAIEFKCSQHCKNRVCGGTWSISNDVVKMMLIAYYNSRVDEVIYEEGLFGGDDIRFGLVLASIEQMTEYNLLEVLIDNRSNLIRATSDSDCLSEIVNGLIKMNVCSKSAYYEIRKKEFNLTKTVNETTEESLERPSSQVSQMSNSMPFESSAKPQMDCRVSGEPENKKEILKKANEELKNMVGMKTVKRALNVFSKRMMYQLLVEDELSFGDRLLHCSFTGNPGTGKTSIAQTYTDLLYCLGMIKTNKMVVAKAHDLIAGFVGQTSKKTQDKIDESLDGVLFIDEAYKLTPKNDGKGYEKECIDTLVENMTEKKGNFVVIFAGYLEEIQEFLDTNPGLKSRVVNNIHFPDYSEEELIEILLRKVKLYSKEGVNTTGIVIDEKALMFARLKIREAMKSERFGNGRYIEVLVEKMIDSHAEIMLSDIVEESEDIVIFDKSELVELSKNKEMSNKLIITENVIKQIAM